MLEKFCCSCVKSRGSKRNDLSVISTGWIIKSMCFSQYVQTCFQFFQVSGNLQNFLNALSYTMNQWTMNLLLWWWGEETCVAQGLHIASKYFCITSHLPHFHRPQSSRDHKSIASSDVYSCPHTHIYSPVWRTVGPPMSSETVATHGSIYSCVCVALPPIFIR